jgi:hypothetical protein
MSAKARYRLGAPTTLDDFSHFSAVFTSVLQEHPRCFTVGWGVRVRVAEETLNGG